MENKICDKCGKAKIIVPDMLLGWSLRCPDSNCEGNKCETFTCSGNSVVEK